jgi:hypothetical protein
MWQIRWWLCRARNFIFGRPAWVARMARDERLEQRIIDASLGINPHYYEPGAWWRLPAHE